VVAPGSPYRPGGRGEPAGPRMLRRDHRRPRISGGAWAARPPHPRRGRV